MRQLRELFWVAVFFTVAAAAPMHAQTFLTNGLVAYYTFNGAATDLSGNQNHGVVAGATLAEDRFGVAMRAYQFATPGDRISTSTATGLPAGADDFTISFWVNVAQDSATHQIFVCNGALEQFQVHMGPRENGKAQIGVQLGGTGAGYTDFIPWSLGRWYQITVTRSDTTLTIYRDATQASQQITALRNEADVAHRNLTFGYRPDDGRQFYGRLDEIRIYSRALSAAEVLDLHRLELGPALSLIKAVKPSLTDLVVGTKYQLQVSHDGAIWTNSGVPFIATDAAMVYPQYFDANEWSSLFFRARPGIDLSDGLVAYYPFKGDAKDFSDRANDGTVHSATLTADRFGRPAEAFHFDGTNSYIALPPTDVFTSSTYSISLWFNAARLPNSADHPHEAAMLISKGRNQFELHLGAPPFADSGIRFLPRLLTPNTGELWDARDAGVTAHQWRHLVALFDGASNLARLFLDGVELATTYVTGPDGDDGYKGPVRLGMRYDATEPGTGVPFEGDMDSLRIYNRLLTPGEILALGELAD